MLAVAYCNTEDSCLKAYNGILMDLNRIMMGYLHGRYIDYMGLY